MEVIVRQKGDIFLILILMWLFCFLSERFFKVNELWSECLVGLIHVAYQLLCFFVVVVVFSFFFCWSPFHAQRLMFVFITLYGNWTATSTSAQHLLFVFSGIFTESSQLPLSASNVSGIFYYFNSALNPILYSVLSKRFRRGFSDIKRKLLNKVFHGQSLQSDGNSSLVKESPLRNRQPRYVASNSCVLYI